MQIHPVAEMIMMGRIAISGSIGGNVTQEACTTSPPADLWAGGLVELVRCWAERVRNAFLMKGIYL